MPHPHTLVTLSLPALLALPLAPLARAETPAEATRAAARTITDARCGAHVEFLASDLLEGRATPSRGLDLAAEYVRSHFARLNLEPGGEKGAWFQGFPVLKEIRLETSAFRSDRGRNILTAVCKADSCRSVLKILNSPSF